MRFDHRVGSRPIDINIAYGDVGRPAEYDVDF